MCIVNPWLLLCFPLLLLPPQPPPPATTIITTAAATTTTTTAAAATITTTAAALLLILILPHFQLQLLNANLYIVTLLVDFISQSFWNSQAKDDCI